jgi:hypothetical protein
MRAYALSEIGDRLAIDVFIRKEDAWLALEDALRDEPQWAAGCSSRRSSSTNQSSRRTSTIVSGGTRRGGFSESTQVS